jgi:glycylpeptide N-tetradecanoyltransferase
MGNDSAFEELKFRKGDGSLYYYMFNYRLPNLEPNQLGIVLV